MTQATTVGRVATSTGMWTGYPVVITAGVYAGRWGWVVDSREEWLTIAVPTRRRHLKVHSTDVIGVRMVA